MTSHQNIITTPVSEAETQGVQVTVKSAYLPEQSIPFAQRYVFGYTVTIKNRSSVTVQLRARHWIIQDGYGKKEEVRGPGVVGQQPWLKPGDSFEYNSGAVLKTQRGSMQGTYKMQRDDGTEFDATVAQFSLEMPFSLN